MLKTKTLTFALMHFSIAFSVAYLLTGSLFVGGLVAIIEPSLNTVAFYFHEKFWQSKGRMTLSSAWQSSSESYALSAM